MSAISFQEEWINKILSGTKQQTTRPKTNRIKVCDMCNIYNQQRRRITDKAERHLTECGIEMMRDRYGMTKRQKLLGVFPEHFLGKVKITEVYNIQPREMTGEELEAWAWADGFYDRAQLGFTEMELADTWFRAHYGDGWMLRTWTVIRWAGWIERYFEPEADLR